MFFAVEYDDTGKPAKLMPAWLHFQSIVAILIPSYQFRDLRRINDWRQYEFAGRRSSEVILFEVTNILSRAEETEHNEYDKSQTLALYTGTLTEEQVTALSRDICSAVPLGQDSLCAIFGYGSQLKSTYREIDQLPGAKVLWLGCFGPWWLSPLLWITASKGGLVAVESREQITSILKDLGTLAMVELISYPAVMSDQLIDHVRRNRWRSQPGRVASTDASYFCFGFDGDYSYDAEGRLYTWCAVGNRCSPELRHAISKYVED